VASNPAPIERTLHRYGATKFGYGWDADTAVIGFESLTGTSGSPWPCPTDAPTSSPIPRSGGSGTSAAGGRETPVARVEINAGGRHIIVDQPGAVLADVATAARELWQGVESPQPSPGPAMGFTTETRWHPPLRHLDTGVP
jgi:hypothetical protein